MLRLTPFVTQRLPNDFLRVLISRMLMSAPAALEQLQIGAPYAVAKEQNAKNEDGTDEEQPMVGLRADVIFHQEEQRGADQRAHHGADAAQYQHHDDIARHRPMQDVRRNKPVVDDVETAAEAGQSASDRERQAFIEQNRVADRAHPLFVLPDP